MTPHPDFKGALEILKSHNTWRRGCDVTPMTNPKELGTAIDTAIVALLIADALMQEPSEAALLRCMNSIPVAGYNISRGKPYCFTSEWHKTNAVCSAVIKTYCAELLKETIELERVTFNDQQPSKETRP